MALTPEQKQAHDELEEAIKKVITLTGTMSPNAMMAEWMVIIEGITFDEQGDSMIDFGLLFRGGQVRLTTALGMLEISKDQLLSPQEEGD